MDFDLTPEQLAIDEVATTLLRERSTPDAIRAIEQGDPDRFDRDLWQALADTGMLGVAVPERLGGAGLGIVELCLLLEQVGRRTSPVPVFASSVLGALPIARHGSAEQQAGLLPGVADGTRIVTAALVEPFGTSHRPSVTARPDGDGWRLDGACTNVPAGMVAHTLLVAAAANGTVEVFIVDLASAGVSRQRQSTTSGTPEALVALHDVLVDRSAVLGEGSGEQVLRFMIDHATVASAALMAGVAAEAVRLIGDYTSSRQQFGRPIADFQAVSQRAGDAYVDAQAIHLTTLQAAWRLGAELPADREIAVAKYWAAAGGQRVVHAAMHLHGGIGVDRDYPLHRYFLLAKQLELYLGGATRQLLSLGAILAAAGPVR